MSPGGLPSIPAIDSGRRDGGFFAGDLRLRLFCLGCWSQTAPRALSDSEHPFAIPYKPQQPAPSVPVSSIPKWKT